jgi:hypothetical protein
MSQDQISYSDSNFERVYLVGIKLQHGAHQADLYTLVLYNEVARNDQNRPLTRDGRIVFFRSVEQLNDVLDLGDLPFRKYKPLKPEISYVYDLPRVLHIIESERKDEAALVADFINELLDFVAAVGRNLPEAYRGALGTLADATTFDKDLSYLDAQQNRICARDALLWALGAILAQAEIPE